MVPTVTATATATAQEVAALKAEKAAAATGTKPQAGGRVLSGGQATNPPAAQPFHTTIRAPQAAATATPQSRAPTQAVTAPRAAARQTRAPPPAAVGGPSKLPHHPARPSTPTQPAQGASGSRNSSPANANGRTSTKSTPSKSDKPHGSDVDPRDLVPPSAPQIKESNDGQFWFMDLHPWQKGYMEIKGGSLFHK